MVLLFYTPPQLSLLNASTEHCVCVQIISASSSCVRQCHQNDLVHKMCIFFESIWRSSIFSLFQETVARPNHTPNHTRYIPRIIPKPHFAVPSAPSKINCGSCEGESYPESYLRNIPRIIPPDATRFADTGIFGKTHIVYLVWSHRVLSEVIELSSRLRRPDFTGQGRSRNKSCKRMQRISGWCTSIAGNYWFLEHFWIFLAYTRKASCVSGDKFWPW